MWMRPRSSTWEWGAFAAAMRSAEGSCDSWVAKRLFAATRASFGRWLALGPSPCAPDDAERAGTLLTYGCSLGAYDRVRPKIRITGRSPRLERRYCGRGSRSHDP